MTSTHHNLYYAFVSLSGNSGEVIQGITLYFQFLTSAILSYDKYCRSLKVVSVARFRTRFSSFFIPGSFVQIQKLGYKKEKNIESFLFAQNYAVFFCMCVAHLVPVLCSTHQIYQSVALAYI